MSLLMDALKRAEASKQQASRNESPAALTSTQAAELAGLSLEPIGSDGTNRSTPLPDLASHLKAVDADLQASATMAQAAAQSPPQQSPKATPAFATPDNGREAAKTMFAAKTALEPNRTGLWFALGILGLCALGIAIYFWLQLNSLGANPLSTRPVATPATIRTAPASTPVAAVPVPNPYASSTETSDRHSDTKGVQNPTERAAAANALSRDKPVGADNPPVLEPTLGNSRVQLTRTRPVADPNILRGWRSLQAGSLEAARKDYEQGLRADPKNVDALMGLAVIASHQGRSADAERYYQMALEADPKDAAAQAAMIGLSAPGDPAATESRLKNALSGQPESPSLNFALGNLYAREQRWNEAQQAYFNAVTGESDNPDYLFNLAVSLDQMRQPKLASQYYKQALEAAEKRPAAFDRERIRQRLSQLITP